MNIVSVGGCYKNIEEVTVCIVTVRIVPLSVHNQSEITAGMLYPIRERGRYIHA